MALEKIRKNSKIDEFLTPKTDVLKINGKLIYHEGSRAWSKILMKKEMINIFKDLQNKQENFGYIMEYPVTEEAKKEFLDELKKSNNWPIMLRFRRIEGEK